MEQRKLISMVKYTLTKNDSSIMREQYAYFLEKKPNIGMFVPAKEVDGVWIVLEEPKGYDLWVKGKATCIPEYLEYYDSKNFVVFEGDFGLLNGWCLQFEDGTLFDHINNLKNYTIEDLLIYKLTLTEQKAKELGL